MSSPAVLTLSICLCLACVPHPESVREARAHFPRQSLVGSVILDAPPPLRPLGAVFDDRVELLGVELDPPRPRAGDTAAVRFVFRVRRPLFDDFQVFVHGDPSGASTRRLFADHWPAQGRYPSGMWQAGELIDDRFSLQLPSDYAGSRLSVYTGLYKGELRLPLTDPGQAAADRDNRALAFELAL